MARLLVVIVGGMQGWLESQYWEDLEKRKETHPKVVCIIDQVKNRQQYYF